MKKIVLLSRKSFLAKIQTHIAKIEINKIKKNLIDIHYSSSVGDKDLSAKAWEQHGFGIFTNSLSKKLVLKEADIVVHSYKDLPVKNLNKTSFVCLKRDDPRDIILIKRSSLNKKKLVIGTSSPRRKYYLKKLKEFLPFQELKSIQIRGNVPSRLEKVLNSSKEDGLFIAKAAIDRILKYGQKIDKKEYKNFRFNFEMFEKVILPISEFPSAAAQGCIALEFRNDDEKIKKILEKINHMSTSEDCYKERKYLYKWGGGCNLDIGVTIENVLNEKILFGPGKAANAGGVAVSGIEMSQNSTRIPLTREKVDNLLKEIMERIHTTCVQYGTQNDFINYVDGANVGGFVRVADSMIDQGIV